MEQILGLDIGYGDTKVITAEKVFKFPTAIEKIKESFVDFGGKNSDFFKYNGKQYIIGKNALSKALTTRGFSFLEKYSPLIAFKAIKDANLDITKPITLKTGLSLVNWNEKEKFIEALRTIQIDNNIVKCKIKLFAQGEGIFLQYKGDKKGIVAIVDIGSNTFDFLVFEDGKPRADLSFANKNGVYNAIIELQNIIQKKYGSEISEQAAKNIFDTGSITLFGETIDLTNVIEDIKEEYTENILEEMRNKRVEILQRANAVIFAGGGAYFLEGKNYPKNVLFAEKPYEYINAKGYYNG